MDKKGKAGAHPQRHIIIFVLIAAGALLLLLGARGTSVAKDQSAEPDAADELEKYSEYLENKTRQLCESVYGVSDVSVLVSLEGGFETVYAKADGGYVVLGSGSNAHLAQVQIKAPSIAGIGISCRGGEDEAVRTELISLISAAFGIGTNKIHISASD